MRHILAARHRPTLAHLASSNAVLAFDYDGTLAPLVGDPGRARLRRRTRRLLIAVAQRYPCLVISGRGSDDVARRLGGVPLWNVFGNHGVDAWGQHPGYARQVREWVGALRNRLDACRGVVVEDKTYSVAIHYRRAREKRAALTAIEHAVTGLRGARVIDGKQSVNLVPKGAPGKGAALERSRKMLGCDCALYLGDDETDEDAFAAGPPERLLAVRVGAARASKARYYLRSQGEIDDLLEALAALRRRRQPFAARG